MKTAPLVTKPNAQTDKPVCREESCREGIRSTGIRISEPRVTIEGSRYRVDLGENAPSRRHLVNKNRECSCGERDCPAIDEVKRYLQAGGRRAPHLEVPDLCPICGGAVFPDRRWNGKYTREAGWHCTNGGLAHFLEAKARRIQEQLARNPWLIPTAPGYPGVRRDELITWEECQIVNQKVFLATGYDPTC